jgi:hypothetical protein
LTLSPEPLLAVAPSHDAVTAILHLGFCTSCKDPGKAQFEGGLAESSGSEGATLALIGSCALLGQLSGSDRSCTCGCTPRTELILH